MLKERVVIEIEQMLAEKVPHRTIALKTGISRATISAISTGKRTVTRRCRARYPSGYVRCKCGLKVKLPCLRCAIDDGTAEEKVIAEEWRQQHAERRIHTPTRDELDQFYDRQKKLREAAYAESKYEPTEEEEDYDD